MRDDRSKVHSRHFGRITARWTCALGIVCLLAGAAAAAAQPDELCGATITENLKLDRDVSCPADGLIVGADGIRIDLNGHTLSGADAGVGVTIVGRSDISILNGAISHFATGVRVMNSTDLDFKHLEFHSDRDGIDFQAGSIGSTVKDSVFRDAAVRGIMLRGGVSGIDIKNNQFINDRVGILLFGIVDGTVKGNQISGSSVAGIRINALATGNVLKDNLVSSSLAGIEFLVVSGAGAQGNELKGNTLSANGCGLKGPTAGNTFVNNAFVGNTTDICP